MDFINALIVLLNYTVIPALTYGSQLALGAIFVTLIYGILRFANFATGDMMSFGTMFGVLLTYYFQSKGISFGFLPTALLTIPFAVAMMIFYMLLIDKTVFSYYRIKKSPPVQLAMVSLGVMFVTQAIIRIIIGKDKELIFKSINKFTACNLVSDLKEAVTHAFKISSAGDYIMLSPACSSLDMYKDYKERGNEFKKIVSALAND